MSEEIEVPPPEGRLPNDCFHAFLRAARGCALLLLDTTGQILAANRGAEDLTGYTEDELCGRFYDCLFSQADRQSRAPTHALKVALNQGNYEADGRLQRKDGSNWWARLSLSCAHDDDGTLCGWVLVIQDMPEKRTAGHALPGSEHQFRTLVEGVRDYAIYMLDPKGYITSWNAGASLIKGYAAEDIIGRHFSAFYTEEDRQRGEPERGLKAALRYNTFENEAWRVRKDGTRFWASIVIDPVYDEAGKLLGYAKITRDITRKKRDQDKLARQRESMHQSQKLEALGRLTGSVAHDFNNMLSVIRTAAEMLGSGMRLAHDHSHYIRLITDASERAARLTGQLMAFARQQPLRLEVFNPAARIEGLVNVIETTLGSRNALVVDLAADLGNVESDTSQFDTALLNLLINARDAMDEGGTVTLAARNEETALEDDDEVRAWVAIEVRDEGSGIDSATLARIFEPFFTTKPINKGTGLGLSQVYGFVKQSGGEIKVTSTPHQETSFILYLPRAKAGTEDAWRGLLTPAAGKELPDSLARE